MNILTSETDRFKSKYWGKKSKQWLTNVCKRDNGELFAIDNGNGDEVIGELTAGSVLILPLDRNDVIEVNCTGRRTEDGTPIYEGDFVASDYKRQPDYEIIFSGGRFLARHHFFKYGEMQYNDFDLHTRNLCHVIGNKFENPELMEAQQ